MASVNRSYLSTILLDLRCFHRTNFKKKLPPELYRFLGEFLLPNYRKIPLSGYNLSRVMNLSNNFPETTPWSFNKYKTTNRHTNIIKDLHCFGQEYTINVCQAIIRNRFSLLKIDFLKVKFGKYYLPILSFSNNNKGEFLDKLEELSLIKDFEIFKQKIQEVNPLKTVLRKITKIIKRGYVFRMLTYYSKPGSKIIYNHDNLQELINDVYYFHQIIYDSRHNYFKLRHIHYLLFKLIKSFGNYKNIYSSEAQQDSCCELRTIQTI